jgi:predicted DNA-binding transcriptional regulator AlpA
MNRPDGIVPRLLKRQQSADYLNLSPSQFDLFRTRDDFPRPVPIPSDRNPTGVIRVPLWDQRDLDAWIDKLKVTMSSEVHFSEYAGGDRSAPRAARRGARGHRSSRD